MVRTMKKAKIFRTPFYLILFLVSLFALIPMLHILADSLSSPERVSQLSGLGILPKGFTLVYYQAILSNPVIMRSILNSVVITAAGTAIELAITSMAAYALTRPKLVGKKGFMVFIIIVMVFQPGIVPQYLLIKQLGLIDNMLSVILYQGCNVYYLIIMMRFFEEVPESLSEAARIDGAGNFRIFTSLMLPLSKPALATVGMFYAVLHWNEYYYASLYLNDMSKWPLQLILRQFVVVKDISSIIGTNSLMSYSKMAQLDYNSMQAATIMVAMLPVLVIYPIVLKYYARGAMEGSIKE